MNKQSFFFLKKGLHFRFGTTQTQTETPFVSLNFCFEEFKNFKGTMCFF